MLCQSSLIKLHFVPVCLLKTCGATKVYLYTFLTSAPDGDEWSAPRSGNFHPRKDPRPCTLNMGLGGQQSWSGCLGKGASFLPLLGTCPQFLGSSVWSLVPMSTRLARFQLDPRNLIWIFIAQHSTLLWTHCHSAIPNLLPKDIKPATFLTTYHTGQHLTSSVVCMNIRFQYCLIWNYIHMIYSQLKNSTTLLHSPWSSFSLLLGLLDNVHLCHCQPSCLPGNHSDEST